MKATRLRLVLILMQLLFLGRNEVSAQITIDNAPTISQLVNGILIPTGSGTVVSNVTFQGVRLSAAQSQASKFTTATTTLAQMGFSSGVVLYSGYTTSIPLPLANNPRKHAIKFRGIVFNCGRNKKYRDKSCYY